MADLSLDEIIRQKNVKVQFKNNASRGPIHRKNVTGNPNPNFQSHNVKRTFDARSKLGPKKALTDARDKITINKQNGKGDARNKIVQKQVQKGTFDARSLLKKHQRKTNGAVQNFQGVNNFANIQPITRTLPNPMMNMDMPIAPLMDPLIRQIPNPGPVFPRNAMPMPKMGGAPPMTGPAEAVPIIQINNDRYQQRKDPMPPPSMPNWSAPFSQPPPQPAHLAMAHSSHQNMSFQQPSSHPQASHHQRHQNPPSNADYHRKPSALSASQMPEMHISNVKAVEAAGMRPVSSRSGSSSSRASTGTAGLLAKHPITPSQSSSLKRRQPAAEVGGPLRLGKGGGPGLQVGIGESSSPPKRAKIGLTASNPIHIQGVEAVDNSKFLSPLQGYRVIVTNLFSRVTQEDIIELFSVVGPLKKAKLLKEGSAEVVYTTKEDAVKAVNKYHGRELDGQPMYVKMTTPVAASVKMTHERDPDITGEALKLYKKPSSLGPLPVAPIEIPTILRALFKVGPPAPNKSVKFTVKI